MRDWVLNLDVIEGPLAYGIWGFAALCVVVLLWRKPTLGRVLASLVGLLAGALIGVGIVLVINATQAFGGTVPRDTLWWLTGGLAAVGLSIAAFWDSRLWRKLFTLVSIVSIVVAIAFGINAAFGINRTIGDVIGVSTLDDFEPLPSPEPENAADRPLYETWNPPADMPSKGEVRQLSGEYRIVSTAGFVPREASIYLPPAALVDTPPVLPVVVHMMGKPGDPNPQFVQDALDEIAAKNKGLAPIVIVADQLGDPDVNPACVDSEAYGGVSTYFNVDIPAYIKENLPVADDPALWTISGYSNGGACAFVWAAQHPEIWGNLISISGEEFPGMEEPDHVLKQVFGGDAAAYQAARPAALLEKNAGKFSGHFAVFTAGEHDAAYVDHAEKNAALAEKAGFDTTLYIVPGADHVVTGLRGGLSFAFEALYPHIELAPKK